MKGEKKKKMNTFFSKASASILIEYLLLNKKNPKRLKKKNFETSDYEEFCELDVYFKVKSKYFLTLFSS